MIKKSISASGGENVRIDKFLANQILNMTRTQIKKLFLNGLVQVNESFAKPGSILKGDEIITFSVPEVDQNLDQIKPEHISLNLLYEDESIIAINKPSGLVVHPGAGNHEKTMIGVVAQEIETVSPKLVYTNDDGYKEVSYSVLYMKAIKALQEAITKIETLETKVAALEG